MEPEGSCFHFDEIFGADYDDPDVGFFLLKQHSSLQPVDQASLQVIIDQSKINFLNFRFKELIEHLLAGVRDQNHFQTR